MVPTITVKIENNTATASGLEKLTAGSVNAYKIKFDFPKEWKGLHHYAVFRANGRSIQVLLDDSNECYIPWETTEFPAAQATIGCYAMRGQELVYTTTYASIGQVHRAAEPSDNSEPPTPNIWYQELEARANTLSYEDDILRLLSDDRVLGEVSLPMDHSILRNRDAEDQHPLGSISGLVDELNRIPEPVEALTNSEIERLLR